MKPILSELKTVEYFKNMIQKGGYKRICNSVSTLKLRPNDQKALLGEENYKHYTLAVEEILNENYSNDRLTEYYLNYNREKEGWMDFKRWLIFN